MPIKLKEKELRSLSLLRDLTTDELGLVTSLMQRRSVPRGRTIISMGSSGSGVFLISKGIVKICTPHRMGEEEKDVILALCGVGEVLGEIDALSSRGHTASVVTLEDSHFLWLSAAEFRTCLCRQPKLSRSLNEIFVKRLQRQAAWESARALLNLEGRVARQLLLLGRDHGTFTDKGLVIQLRLAQRDIAAMVGSTRERVNQVLSAFKKRGLLQVNREGRLVLHNHVTISDYCIGCADHSQLLSGPTTGSNALPLPYTGVA